MGLPPLVANTVCTLRPVFCPSSHAFTPAGPATKTTEDTVVTMGTVAVAKDTEGSGETKLCPRYCSQPTPPEVHMRSPQGPRRARTQRTQSRQCAQDHSPPLRHKVPMFGGNLTKLPPAQASCSDPILYPAPIPPSPRIGPLGACCCQGSASPSRPVQGCQGCAGHWAQSGNRGHSCCSAQVAQCHKGLHQGVHATWLRTQWSQATQ